MDQESITRGILSGIVDRYIREIAQDPSRSIRKLLDMAERTSDGPTQKICYQMMQQMAADQTSPYYEMIHHLVTHTDPKTINNFGINLGHNAWTFSCGKIRRIIGQKETALSWAVIIDRSITENRIPFSSIRDMVKRGRAHEVYAWLLIPSESLDEWDEYKDLFQEHSDSVFGIIVTPDHLDPHILNEARKIHNLMFILDTDSQEWTGSAEQLSEKGLLYSACRYIRNEKQAEEVLSGAWFEDLIPLHPLMAFSITTEGLSHRTALALKNYMWTTRLDQVYPTLPVDLISDFVIINRLVTHNDIFYRVNSDGCVSAAHVLQFEPTALTFEDLFN